MISEEMFNKRKKYYTNKNIQFELLRAMRNREVVLMSYSNHAYCIRGHFIKSIEKLNEIFDFYNFYEKDYNIYLSVAKYSFIPLFSIDLTKRSSETSHFFSNDVYKYIMDYDIFLDFDIEKVKNYGMLLNEVRKANDILRNNKITYNLFFSGSGFQIIIPSSQIEKHKEFFAYNPNIDKKEPFNITTKNFIEDFATRFKLFSICKIGLGNTSKLRKCEYSLVEDRVCFPLDNLYLIDLYLNKHFDSNYILNNVNGLGFRGLEYANLNNMENNENFKNFLDKYMLRI